MLNKETTKSILIFFFTFIFTREIFIFDDMTAYCLLFLYAAILVYFYISPFLFSAIEKRNGRIMEIISLNMDVIEHNLIESLAESTDSLYVVNSLVKSYLTFFENQMTSFNKEYQVLQYILSLSFSSLSRLSEET